MEDTDNNTGNIKAAANEDLKESKKARCSWKECLCMMLAAFLGGFLAVYFVTDQFFYRHYKMHHFSPDRFERRMMKDFNKMYEHNKKAFEHDFDRLNKNFDDGFGFKFKEVPDDFDFFDDGAPDYKSAGGEYVQNPFKLKDTLMEGVKIKTEIEKDEYKIIVDLKAFQGDESRINYNISGRKLTVFGSSKVKDKRFEQDIAFSQDFLLPYNADTAYIKKKKDGNSLVIEVPLKA